jgi:hypothetical protein
VSRRVGENPSLFAARLGLPLPEQHQRLTWDAVLDLCVAAYWRRRRDGAARSASRS